MSIAEIDSRVADSEAALGSHAATEQAPPPPAQKKWGRFLHRLSRADGTNRFSVPRLAWTDTLVLAGILLVFNFLLAPYDLGWVNLSPSPYLLVPVLVGCRYGFAAGVLSGFTCGAIALLGQAGLHSIRVPDLLAQHGYFFGSLMFVGGVCGEIQHTYLKRERQLSSFNQQLQDRVKKLDHDLTLLGESKAELERMLATHNAELATLDVEIRRLFESNAEDVYQNVLLLLNRYARITAGGLYLLQPEDILARKAVLGPLEHLPAEMKAAAVEMIHLALKRRTVVTIPEFWQQPHDQHHDYLMAAPLLDSNERVLGVVIVTSMPFMALQEKTVHLVGLICRWAARVIELRSAEPGIYRAAAGGLQPRVFTAEFFRHNLELCYTSFRQHHLPSAVILFALPARSLELQPQLEKTILPHIRGADFPAQLDLTMPNLAVLLPFSGERGARISVDRILTACKREPAFDKNIKVHVWTFNPKHTFEHLWNDLSRYGEKNAHA